MLSGNKSMGYTAFNITYFFHPGLPSLMNNQNSNGSEGGHQLNHDELEILKKIEAQNR